MMTVYELPNLQRTERHF